MPELPEVETIRRGLQRFVLGKKIKAVEIRHPALFLGDPHVILEASFLDVRRYGKGLVIDLSNQMSIAAHVKMTGQFIYKGDETLKNFHPKLGIMGELPNKWTHVIFHLSENSTLFYNDIRKFGWLKIVPTDKVAELSFFKNLGPEPLADLTLPVFETIVKTSAMPIKPLLMDQKKISGVGNIYANDALFLAGIDPRRKAASLTERERAKLFEAMLAVLTKGIESGGASEINYINVEGGKGTYQQHFLVYGKSGKACQNCGNPIERIKQAGRSTFFCPHCQH